MNGIPTTKDFLTSGKELLILSWEIVIEILEAIDQLQLYCDDSKKFEKNLLESSQRRLATSLIIAQQGVELCLKGIITETSPYLLLVDPPAKWPSKKDNDLNFSDFRTVDAQDLIKIIETFCDNTLSCQFKDLFDNMRKKRNKIMHSIDKNLKIDVTEQIEAILFLFKELFPKENWIQSRLNFLNAQTQIYSEIDGDDGYNINSICSEISLTINLLKPAKVKSLFGITKNQRRYLCPNCKIGSSNDIDFDEKLALLKPNKPDSNKVFCIVCNQKHIVIREECGYDSCKGNVLDEEGTCLTCS